ncbi:PE-PGRS family protein [Actinosynnema mirum DSM 43827]|uniref:PE-PGRS family protein n=1 Tax=Actinosynnema mirum (strain ATCC 29888 / DSM 43827 / JCM 3225 / NBRC 14064 / NCIMB 13271 / NRRL B-12336 / IMRU 3971 / 101) TaxID=446462 RepID=C6WKD4_ACTMD|nr:PE-PGRS family protein [Actinosynnema mirum DSM 43827]
MAQVDHVLGGLRERVARPGGGALVGAVDRRRAAEEGLARARRPAVGAVLLGQFALDVPEVGQHRVTEHRAVVPARSRAPRAILELGALGVRRALRVTRAGVRGPAVAARADVAPAVQRSALVERGAQVGGAVVRAATGATARRSTTRRATGQAVGAGSGRGSGCGLERGGRARLGRRRVLGGVAHAAERVRDRPAGRAADLRGAVEQRRRGLAGGALVAGRVVVGRPRRDGGGVLARVVRDVGDVRGRGPDDLVDPLRRSGHRLGDLTCHVARHLACHLAHGLRGGVHHRAHDRVDHRLHQSDHRLRDRLDGPRRGLHHRGHHALDEVADHVEQAPAHTGVRVDRRLGGGHVGAAVQAHRVGQRRRQVGRVRRRAAHRRVQAEQRGRLACRRGRLRGVGVLGQVDQLAHQLDLGLADLAGRVVEPVGRGVAVAGGADEVAVGGDEPVPAGARGGGGGPGHAAEDAPGRVVRLTGQPVQPASCGAPRRSGGAQLVLVGLRPRDPGPRGDLGQLRGQLDSHPRSPGQTASNAVSLPSSTLR